MSTHVLLNLLKELGKRDKMQGLPSILSHFRNKFNKFNKIGIRILDLSYEVKIPLKSHFLLKVIILSLCTPRCYRCNNLFPKICKPMVVYRF